jgi:large subunit ribosomal protein L6
MSRIGAKPIEIPADVTVQVEGNKVLVKGPNGQLTKSFDSEVKVVVENNQVIVSTNSNSKTAKQKWGLYRSLISNMVIGVKDKFKKVLHINGVGYKANVQNNFLNLNLGFSHDIKFAIPEGVEVKCPKATIVELFSHDKEAVGQIAAEIRHMRPPEPYKGKGVKYEGEYIFRKEGKK